jgi:prevent-host-death family protein
MTTIGATEFKQKCLSILDRVDPDGVVITKHGKPVAKLIPIEETSADLLDSLKGKLEIRGDIFSTGIRWDAES